MCWRCWRSRSLLELQVRGVEGNINQVSLPRGRYSFLKTVVPSAKSDSARAVEAPERGEGDERACARFCSEVEIAITVRAKCS